MFQGSGWLKGLVGPQAFAGDNSEVTARFGRNRELVVAGYRGRYGELTSRGKVFSFGVTAVTVPVVANNLVSVIGFYNPPNSGVDMELIDIDISQVLATTVVDAFGVYASATAALSAAATFTTLGSALCRRVADPAGNLVRAYSAVTHSGTPVKVANIGQDGAVTNSGSDSRRKSFDGQLIIPPGILASIAASTAAGTTSGLAVDVTWAEIPIQ